MVDPVSLCAEISSDGSISSGSMSCCVSFHEQMHDFMTNHSSLLKKVSYRSAFSF